MDFETKKLHIYNESSFVSFFDKTKLNVEQSLSNEDIIYRNETEATNAYFLGEIAVAAYVTFFGPGETC